MGQRVYKKARTLVTRTILVKFSFLWVAYAKTLRVETEL